MLVRHGETEGESSIRYHGSGDVPLSETGRAQMRAAGRRLPRRDFGVVMASPLSRSFEGAQIVAPGRKVVLEDGFREIDFGRWEGLTREEIRDLDPDLYEAWIRRPEAFAYPQGESRETFAARVEAGLERLLALPVESALLVLHKGVIRTIVRRLCGVALEPEEPALGEMVRVTAGPGGWDRVAPEPAAGS
ncbi:MAG: histidine phosphatase family protein [Myxococcota bacterium]